jgi:folate-dependent phosphoribosylglycinamide formyltransferase PurN
MRGWLSAGHQIAGFWYGPQKGPGPLHRDRRLAWLAPHWSIGAIARRHGIPLRQIPRPATWPERVAAFAAEKCDVLVSVYFPNIVPADVLALFGRRAVNLHPAPLPRYRGPNPIYAMVLDRSILTDGAMTLHVMTPGLDEGPIIAQAPVPFPPDGSFTRYLLAAANAGRDLVAEALPAYLDGRRNAIPQASSQATYVRVSREEMMLSPDLPTEDVLLRCRFLARRRAIGVKDSAGLRVAGFLRDLGPRTGEPSRPRLTTVEMDTRDRRLLLRRRTALSSLRGKWDDWRAWMTVHD